MLAHTRRLPAHRVADDHPVVAELVCGHIPGARGLRGPGAGKRIDVFATAIQTC